MSTPPGRAADEGGNGVAAAANRHRVRNQGQRMPGPLSSRASRVVSGLILQAVGAGSVAPYYGDQISAGTRVPRLPCSTGSARLFVWWDGRGPRVAQQSPQGLRTSVNPGGEYSTEVPQQVRIWRDADTRSGTVTCGDGRGWTWCLLFASRESGVRVPLAPQVRGIIRTASFESTAAKYSNRDRLSCRTRVRVGPCHRGLRRIDPRSGVEFRATEQERCLWEGPVPLARRPAGSVLNLPFQGRLLPLRQRVSEWQAISVTQE